MANLLKSANEDFEKNPQFVSETISQITDIAQMGATVPATAEELKNRINEYFVFCENHGLRPGIESLALSCGMDRRRFWEICNGSRGAEWQEICLRAKQCIISFLETSMYHGRLNPAAGIFALKNIAAWQDSVTVETVALDNKDISADALPDFSELSVKNTVKD